MISAGVVLLITMVSQGAKPPQPAAEAIFSEASADAPAGRTDDAIRKLDVLVGRYPRMVAAPSLPGRL